MTTAILILALAQAPHPIYLDLSVEVVNGSAGGSGTIVQVCGRDALVLTCGHIFREGDGPITITRRTGEKTQGQLWAVAASVDLAAVVMPAPPDAWALYARMSGRPAANWELSIARQDPARILAVGWGTGAIAAHRGSFLARIGSHREYTITPRSGDSGGGAWDRDSGEFCGVVVWVSSTRTGGLIGTAAVRQFYQTVHLGRRLAS